MNKLLRWSSLLLFLIPVGCGEGPGPGSASATRPEIPRTWTDSAVATFELPLATPEYSPQHVSEDYYYSLPERVIWKSYPIYHPDHEPEGYRDNLSVLEPEVAFDESKLIDHEAWIEAGAEVFRAPISYDVLVRPTDVLGRAWYEENGIDLTDEGVFPWARWVIREEGKLEVGHLACATCHTRLMSHGRVVEGAQGNFPFEQVVAWRIRNGSVPAPVVQRFARILVGTPWIEDLRSIEGMSLEERAAVGAAVPPGVLVRQGTSFDAPAKIPDLIGVADRKYLDATGLVRHRDIGDLMRYAAANQGMDVLARFGAWVPETGTNERPAPGTGQFPGTADRYGDAQLYALAQFLYSLEPPENPYPFDERARRGQALFESQGCVLCHTPPLFTNNELVPATGFEPPAEHREKYDLSSLQVGTDPTLAMQTRRGTGYYKVPSLKGLWYRGPLEHSGSAATLEDWFDPDRHRDDYVPSGFAGHDAGPRPVVGHPFGLGLSEDDRRALIAYLRTL